MPRTNQRETLASRYEDWAAHVLGCRICTHAEGPACVPGVWLYAQLRQPELVEWLVIIPEA